MKLTLPLFLAAALLTTPGAAQNAQKPDLTLISKATYTCPPEGNSTALSLESGMKNFTVRALIWGQGLGQLRREKKFLMERNGSAAERTYGFLELCESGKSCRPLTGRVELTTDSLIAGNELSGRLYWFESKLNKDVSLPLKATITPRSESCS